MKKLIILLCGLSCSLSAIALSGQAYMDRFNAYRQWYQQLPFNPKPQFIEFIQGSTPLSNKLREKWLYELARTKDWDQFTTYYQPSTDLNLLCYNQMGKLAQGKEKEALSESAPLWLSGDSRPQVCNTLFDQLLKNKGFDQSLITQRIALALDKRNIPLANYLLKQYKASHRQATQILAKIQQNPTQITNLTSGELSSEFYLYGLKRLVAINMDKALVLWEKMKNKTLLSEAHQQAFLAHIALYKAMRNSDDALLWFAKVKPQYYNEVLVDWQIRLALKHRDWKHVTQLINDSKNKDTPCWQYWRARSLEKQGKKEQAIALYEPLAKNRQYYGFLASIRLKKPPSFENEKPSTNLNALKPYQSVMDEIRTLYLSKQSTEASRLLNDFISELPKDEASALVYWVDKELHWHGKSVYLSNNQTLNNQLALRFPLAYQDTVQSYAKKYAIAPEFVYAIIRQESGFREDVVSSVGARGLMQLMPQTASVVCKTGKIAYKGQEQLFLFQKNINIGIAYLQELTKRFNHHPILVAAAYNAGPKQVVYWLRTHPPKEIDVWIETLPWQETRNYLKNVMAFYVVYQYRLNQKTDLSHFLEPL